MRINAFSKTYGGRAVLRMPELELSPGKILAVIGANGSGKSTFAKCVAGVVPADKNAAVLGDGVTVGYMPQKSYAFRMSVLANIRLNCADEARARELMEELRILPLASQRADALSGGETARMAMARLMAKPYDLLILDEPTASMDMESTTLAEALMTRYCGETGCALCLVTHSLQQARRVAQEAVFLSGGELIERGAKERVLYSPEDARTRRFLEFYGQ